MQLRSLIKSFLVNAFALFILYNGMISIFQALDEKIGFLQAFKDNIEISINFAIVLGFLNAILYRKKKVLLPLAQKDSFVSELSKFALENRYSVKKEDNNSIVFWKNKFWMKFFNRIHVQLQKDSAVIIGPVYLVERFEKKILDENTYRKSSRFRIVRDVVLFAILLAILVLPSVIKRTNTVLVYLCDKGSEDYCYDLAQNEIKQGNLEKAKNLYKRACDLGADYSCTSLGKLLEPNDINEAMKYYTLAGKDAWNTLASLCDKGNGNACYVLGDLNVKRGNKEEAKRCYKSACRRGFAQGCAKITELN
jgi:tetratricopeptide (TPR) repeat protein